MTHSSAPIQESLRPYVDAAIEAGFTVHLPDDGLNYAGEYTWIYLSASNQPGCFILHTAQWPRLGQAPELSIPVHPKHKEGTCIAVDYQPLPDDFVATLKTRVARDKVTTRFTSDPRLLPVDRAVLECTTTYVP